MAIGHAFTVDVEIDVEAEAIVEFRFVTGITDRLDDAGVAFDVELREQGKVLETLLT